MTITTETNLKNFEFWAGAKDTAKYLTLEELDTIEAHFEILYPDGMTDIEVNDLFWHNDDFIAELLGYSDFEEIMNRSEE